MWVGGQRLCQYILRERPSNIRILGWAAPELSRNEGGNGMLYRVLVTLTSASLRTVCVCVCCQARCKSTGYVARYCEIAGQGDREVKLTF
jgi:hypothetical protein